MSDSPEAKAAYDTELAAGQTALRRRDLDRARLHFGRAHGIGHHVRCRHIMAHRGLLDVAVRKLDVREMCSQTFLILATYAFDRPAQA